MNKTFFVLSEADRITRSQPSSEATNEATNEATIEATNEDSQELQEHEEEDGGIESTGIDKLGFC